MTRAGRQWRSAVARVESEPGLVVIRSGRAGGKWHLTGMRDPLAANPSLLLASGGVDTNDVVARWEPYVSAEPALLLARARRALASPASVTLSLNGDSLVGTGRAPAFWITRAEALAPALSGIGSVDLSRVSPGLPVELETIAGEIERSHAFFAAGADSLDRAGIAGTTAVGTKFKALVTAAEANHYDIVLRIVGRADPSGAESDNLALSRRRALGVRDRLVSLGIGATRLAPEAIGSNDPLIAD